MQKPTQARVRVRGNGALVSVRLVSCPAIFLFAALLLLLVTSSAAIQSRADDREMNQGPRRVFKDRISPHWFANNTRFWYRNDLRGGAKEFMVVDTERGVREAAFDHVKLAAGLSEVLGAEYRAEKLPFDSIEFITDSKAIRFTVSDTAWQCDLTSYACSRTDAKAAATLPGETTVDTSAAGRRQARGQGEDSDRSSDRSPDGNWTAFVKDHNVFVKSRDGEKEIQLSTDGKEGLAYGRLSWSPDSRTVIAFRIEPGERKEVYLIQSSPPGGGRAKLQAHPYALPGDKFTTYELNLFDVTGQKQTKPDVDRFEHEWETPRLHWNQDGRRFAWQQ